MSGSVRDSVWSNIVKQIQPGWEVCEFASDGYEVCGVVSDAPELSHGALIMKIDWDSSDEGFAQVFEAPHSYRTVRVFDNAVVISSTDRFWAFNPRISANPDPVSNNGST